MIPRGITVNRTIKNIGEAHTGWNHNTKDSDKFLHKSKQQPCPQHVCIRTD
jgi:hypothetical protein